MVLRWRAWRAEAPLQNRRAHLIPCETEYTSFPGYSCQGCLDGLLQRTQTVGERGKSKMDDSPNSRSDSGPILRSIHSGIPTSVRFINHSSVRAKVIWLNYEGEQVLYSTLKPLNGCYDVRTYVTHPWIAVEEESNLRMLLNLAQIYFPTSDGYHHEVFISANVPRSLEDCCQRFLKKRVLPENIGKLPLSPTIIKMISLID